MKPLALSPKKIAANLSGAHLQRVSARGARAVWPLIWMCLWALGTAWAQTEPRSASEPVAPSPATPVTECAPCAPAAPVPPPDPRRIESVTLPDGRRVVVAEAEFEPRSIGSYALRLYAAGDSSTAYDRFLAGVVQPRDGAVEHVLLQDLDRDGRPELVVVLRSAGSGAFLSADAWSFGDRRIARRASVNGLLPDADPLPALAARVRRATAP